MQYYWLEQTSSHVYSPFQIPSPDFPAANALVNTFPRTLAVAPVNNGVPLHPCASSPFYVNARIALRAKAKPALMCTSSEAVISFSRHGEEGAKDVYADTVPECDPEFRGLVRGPLVLHDRVEDGYDRFVRILGDGERGSLRLEVRIVGQHRPHVPRICIPPDPHQTP